MSHLPYALHPQVARSAPSSSSSSAIFVAVCAVICLFARPSSAADRPTLAGVWNAGPLTERWNVGDWGKACGPRPVPQQQPGGQVTVREEGGELLMSGVGRTFR